MGRALVVATDDRSQHASICPGGAVSSDGHEQLIHLTVNTEKSCTDVDFRDDEARIGVASRRPGFVTTELNTPQVHVGYFDAEAQNVLCPGDDQIAG